MEHVFGWIGQIFQTLLRFFPWLVIVPATGAVLWQWSLSDPSETGFIGNLVLTDNLLFLSTNQRTHAIDLTTHASVWRYGKPGHKALSRQGVLYIATTDGAGTQDRGLTAVNLR